jgi:signal transduction histidine kinase
MGADHQNISELINKSEEASQIIVEEILSYWQLRSAENGDIHVMIKDVNTIELLKSAVSRISSHEVGRNKRIEIDENVTSIDFQTDRQLLERVIINLLKNALEATEINGVVTVSAGEYGGKLIFSVRNKGVIPEDIRIQIFQRSFSTKDKYRGIGTYSVKLLTENYLKGKASFISTEAEGTIFRIELDKLWTWIPS